MLGPGRRCCRAAGHRLMDKVGRMYRKHESWGFSDMTVLLGGRDAGRDRHDDAACAKTEVDQAQLS